jgi:hypothetical protein
LSASARWRQTFSFIELHDVDGRDKPTITPVDSVILANCARPPPVDFPLGKHNLCYFVFVADTLFPQSGYAGKVRLNQYAYKYLDDMNFRFGDP